jgi:phosphoglycolate phosphatase
MKFPLLVFDWDGTLVDSIDRIVSSLQYASEEAANITVSNEQAKDVIGLGLIEAISKLHPEFNITKDTLLLEKIADAYREHYLHSNTVPAPLFSGVEDLLDNLRMDGYTLAVSTGKSRRGLTHSMDEHDMSRYFSTTRCAGENKSKPHPEMLHEILDELNFSASQTLMIGDSEHDLKMANNADVQSIGVTHGVHDTKTLEKHNPLICLSHITDLLDFLNHNKQQSK